MKRILQKLIDSDLSSYEIERHTNVASSVIRNLRLGKRKLGNLTLDTAEKLYAYAKEVFPEEGKK